MAIESGYTRKLVLIDKDFQYNYMLTWLGMTLALLCGLVLASVSMVFVFKVQEFDWLVAGNMISAVVITALSMRYMIRFSHRIAGPAYRLNNVIRGVADGTFEGYVTLRKKDYLKRVAESVNYLIDKLNEKNQRTQELGEQARELAEALQAQPNSSPEVREMAQNMMERLNEMTPAGTWNGEAEGETKMKEEMETEMETVSAH